MVFLALNIQLVINALYTDGEGAELQSKWSDKIAGKLVPVLYALAMDPLGPDHPWRY